MPFFWVFVLLWTERQDGEEEDEEAQEEEDLIHTFSNLQKCVTIVDRLVTLPVSAIAQEEILEEEIPEEEISEEDSGASQGRLEDW